MSTPPLPLALTTFWTRARFTIHTGKVARRISAAILAADQDGGGDAFRAFRAFRAGDFMAAVRHYCRYRHAQDAQDWRAVENLAELSRVLYPPHVLSLALINYELAWGATYGYLTEYAHDLVREHIDRTDGARVLIPLLERIERR